ncbi:hypothetical protein GGX14DRAFT_408613 [Mycena pura]|uniref:Uncharacterized protein n=1 Tax=Mycena pura TaxID=153505 RepID=A0AAD6UKL5_9AGAR|nr:hypothetical protein GGX14DRAFT_408613 [Mycena pura]
MAACKNTVEVIDSSDDEEVLPSQSSEVIREWIGNGKKATDTYPGEVEFYIRAQKKLPSALKNLSPKPALSIGALARLPIPAVPSGVIFPRASSCLETNSRKPSSTESGPFAIRAVPTHAGRCIPSRFGGCWWTFLVLLETHPTGSRATSFRLSPKDFELYQQLSQHISMIHRVLKKMGKRKKGEHDIAED